MDQQAKVVVIQHVIHHGATDRVRRLALAVRDGAREHGADVRLRCVAATASLGELPRLRGVVCPRDPAAAPMATPEDLDWADVALFGTPRRHAVVAPELKRLVDAAAPLRKAGRLAGKVYGVFAPATPAPRGPETRLLALTDVFDAWRGLVVPARCVRLFERSDGGADWTLPAAPADPPSHAELAAARCHGRRAVEMALALGVQHRLLPEVA
jgi:NAD(P)H dehydrogenase (quinone)